MRVAVLLLALAASAGCVELGVVTDGSSISYGRTNRGVLIDGVKLPDSGVGFTTREQWALRGNRYGTDELVALLKGVSKRMKKKVKDVRLVIADLSGDAGGAKKQFHASHQSGRDVDILYYMRGPDGQPFEADAMHVFDRRGRAVDGSGITIDIPRMWLVVKELLTAREAYVQYIFMYRPFTEKLIDYAQRHNEDPKLIRRAMWALKQPGDSAPHNDHFHVRVYCAETDRQFGCQDMGPLEMLADREAEAHEAVEAIAAATDAMGGDEDDVADHEPTAADVWSAQSEATAAGTMSSTQSASFGSMLRARAIDLRGWR